MPTVWGRTAKRAWQRTADVVVTIAMRTNAKHKLLVLAILVSTAASVVLYLAARRPTKWLFGDDGHTFQVTCDEWVFTSKELASEYLREHDDPESRRTSGWSERMRAGIPVCPLCGALLHFDPNIAHWAFGAERDGVPLVGCPRVHRYSERQGGPAAGYWVVDGYHNRHFLRLDVAPRWLLDADAQ